MKAQIQLCNSLAEEASVNGCLLRKRGIPPKGNFIQALSGSFVKAPAIDEIGTRSVCLDGNPRQDGTNSTGNSAEVPTNSKRDSFQINKNVNHRKLSDPNKTPSDRTHRPLPSHWSQLGHLTSFTGSTAVESLSDIRTIRGIFRVALVEMQGGPNAAHWSSAPKCQAASPIAKHICMLEKLLIVLSSMIQM
jgi:hypothetical protein